MSARFVYWMNVSLDGFIEHAPGESGGGDWMSIGEELHREFNARAAALTAMVQGRVVYEIMEAFWPAARTAESLPGFLREYGEIWTSAPKVLVSSTRAEAPFTTTVVGGADAVDRLAALKEEWGGEVGVGGATLATALLDAGLLDELWLFTHPAVLGTGRPLFDRLDVPLRLERLEHAGFPGGVAFDRYAIAHRA